VEVASIEYVWEKDRRAATMGTLSRVVFMAETSYQLWFKKNVVNAIRSCWQIENDFSITYRQLSGFSETPKFKTRLKDKDPSKIYLFLQLFDKADYYNISFDTATSGILKVNYQLISGKDNSVLANKFFTVKLLRLPTPAGQLPLVRLVGHPRDFINGLDTILAWCFKDSVAHDRDILLKPAVVFDSTAHEKQPVASLDYTHGGGKIMVKNKPEFEITIMDATARQTGKRKNVGSNSVAGALTLLTGIETNKTRSYYFESDHPFSDGKQLFHCIMYYIEEEGSERRRIKHDDGSRSMERGDFVYLGRRVNTNAKNSIVVTGDTICNFFMSFNSHRPQHTKMWNGDDSTTIVPLPLTWNNNKINEIQLSGELLNNKFTLETSNDGVLKKFTINDKIVAVISGRPVPEKITLYSEVDKMTLKIFTILSLISDNYRNYN